MIWPGGGREEQSRPLHGCSPVPTDLQGAQEYGNYQPGSLCGYCSFCNVSAPPRSILQAVPGICPGALGCFGPALSKGGAGAVPVEERHFWGHVGDRLEARKLGRRLGQWARRE